MKKFIPPISTRVRDREVAKLIKRGSATDDELFAACYGGDWPVRGLHKDTARDEKISFKGFGRDKSLNPLSWAFRLAYVRQEKPEDIHLNGLLLSPLGIVLGVLATRMAFARVHDAAEIFGLELGRVGLAFSALSLASSYRYAAASSIYKLLLPSLAEEVAEEHIHSMQFRYPEQSFNADAFEQLANDIVVNRSKAEKYLVHAKQIADAVFTMMYISGLDSEYEARLGRLMIKGVKSWGRIPENKAELHAALMDMGVKTPSAVETHYADPAFDGLRKIFMNQSRAKGAYLNPSSAEMNIALNSQRSSDVIEFYWRDVLPALYGSLLIKYGDSKGFERMGFSSERDLRGLPVPAEIPLLEGPQPA